MGSGASDCFVVLGQGLAMWPCGSHMDYMKTTGPALIIFLLVGLFFMCFLRIAHLSVELVFLYRVGLRDGTWWQVERKIPAA